MKNELTIGIIGAGNFATFAALAFIKVKGIRIIAVADENETAGEKLAGKLKAKFYGQYPVLLKDKEIELVYIATPPFLHFKISKEALLAGKHVICEKPAALTLAQAQQLKKLAEKCNLLYVVNLMQRYNPLYKTVQEIIHKKILGNFLHGFFENYASDENLNKHHWFWDEDKSGGIFIEHAVHFFDMFSGWLGNGKVINAFQLHRPDVKPLLYDRVQASLLYKDGVVNFYHGFDQPKILDRQQIKLLFEKGDITLYEWIPVKMSLRGLLKNDSLKKLNKLIGTPSTILHHSEPGKRKANGRFLPVTFEQDVTIETGNNADKDDRYRQLLTAMLEDQWRWIKNRKHQQITSSENAVESIRTAEQAKKIAQKF